MWMRVHGIYESPKFKTQRFEKGFEVVEVTKVQRIQEVREPGLVEMDFNRLKPVNIDLRKFPPAVVPRNVPKVNLLEIPSIEKDGPAFQQPNRHQHVDFLLVDALPMRIELAARRPAGFLHYGDATSLPRPASEGERHGHALPLNGIHTPRHRSS